MSDRNFKPPLDVLEESGLLAEVKSLAFDEGGLTLEVERGSRLDRMLRQWPEAMHRLAELLGEQGYTIDDVRIVVRISREV